MKTIIKLTFFLTIITLSSVYAQNNSSSDKNTHNVRIMRNNDGSYTEFRKSSDDRIIERRNYQETKNGTGERILRMSIIYRKDKHGRLRSGRIYDGTGKILYRVVYGYHKVTGKLVAENMYDAREKRTKIITDANGKTKEIEIPVRRLYHIYDAQGRPAKPIAITYVHGKRAEELFKKDGGTSYPRKYLEEEKRK